MTEPSKEITYQFGLSKKSNLQISTELVQSNPPIEQASFLQRKTDFSVGGGISAITGVTGALSPQSYSSYTQKTNIGHQISESSRFEQINPFRSNYKSNISHGVQKPISSSVIVNRDSQNKIISSNLHYANFSQTQRITNEINPYFQQATPTGSMTIKMQGYGLNGYRMDSYDAHTQVNTAKKVTLINKKIIFY